MATYPELVSAKYKNSIAHYNLKERLPIIVTKIIEYLNREKRAIGLKYGERSSDDIKNITYNLSKLIQEMNTNEPLVPFTIYSIDLVLWNKSLYDLTNQMSVAPKWDSAPWLYIESYMYRRIFEIFRSSFILRDFDYFQKQKEDSFYFFTDALLVLGQHLQNVLNDISTESQIRGHLNDLLLISLWSNRCDLPMAAGNEMTQKTNPITDLQALQEYILVNDIPRVIEYVFNTKQKKSDALLVDIILDNAGFELFCDLCLAHFLCATKLAKRVRFYVKRLPWFVSDVTDVDFVWIIDAVKHMYWPDKMILNDLSKIWYQFVSDTVWTIETELFWTYPYPYSEMKQKDPRLYQKLAQADLLIFKGDLNYRKLTSDRMWHTTTSFDTALAGFNPSPLCVLRTIKADTVVGLAIGQANAVGSVRKDWMISGEYAVIQFSQTRT